VFPFSSHPVLFSGYAWWFFQFSSDLWVGAGLGCFPVGVLAYPAVSITASAITAGSSGRDDFPVIGASSEFCRTFFSCHS